VQRQPAQLDRVREGGPVLVRRPARRKEGAVGQFNVNAAVLHRLNRVGNLRQLAGGGGVSELARCDEFDAAALSSLSPPRATIFSASSGNGLCSAFASSHGARIQTSRSSSVIKRSPASPSDGWARLWRSGEVVGAVDPQRNN